ncbi:Os01g0136850, partial [Oryza sativa Japonica Group]
GSGGWANPLVHDAVRRAVSALLDQPGVVLDVAYLVHPLSFSQRVQHLTDRRPHVLLRLQAPERHLGDEIDRPPRLAVRRVPELRVHQLLHLVALDHVHGHVGQVDVAAAPVHVHRRLGGDELDEHHAEAVHVALVRQLVALVVHRVEVPRRALRRRGHVRGVRREQPGEAEVGHLHVEPFVEEDVVRLHVAVHHLRLHRVEVLQRAGRLDGDAEPRRPVEGGRPRRRAAVQVVGERAVGDELVDEEQVAAVGLRRAAEERDEVWVAQPRQDAHLVLELLHALVAVLVQPLHRHRVPIPEYPCNKTCQSADAELPGVAEAVGSLVELLVGEDVGICQAGEAEFFRE